MADLGCQQDCIWNQLKPKLPGIPGRDLLNQIIDAERLTLNLSHTSGAAQIKDLEKGTLPLPAQITLLHHAPLGLTGKFTCSVSVNSIQSIFFRISTD